MQIGLTTHDGAPFRFPVAPSADALMIYRLTFKLILQRMDAQRAHALAARLLRTVSRIPVLGSLVGRVLRPRDPRLHVKALGLTFPSPLGVAAGMDKDAIMFEGLGMLGFGFVEVGTVTADKQSGNPKSQWRLIPDRALLNSMGFPNVGASTVGKRLSDRSGSTIIGVNLGKSAATPIEQAGDDYRAAIRRLGPVFDYVVLNVSSPNTPGLRDLQAVGRLGRLITDVREELHDLGNPRPILIKIAPDLTDAEIDAIADLSLELELDGIIAINTTVNRSGLSTPLPAESLGRGGVSGAPLKARALEVLQRLYARVGDRLVLISVGGIETPDDAWERLLAGATLLQAHSGFVYGGPLWPRRINRGLSRRLSEIHASSIHDAVGATARDAQPAKQSKEDGTVASPVTAPVGHVPVGVTATAVHSLST